MQYDNLSRITEYTDFFGNQYHYGYDELTRPAVVQYPNGIITQYGYDSVGRLHNITHKRETGEVIRSFVYEYDLNRNITKITNEDGSLTDYVYDEWNRLTCETWKNAVGMTTLNITYSFQTAGDDQYGDTGNICSKTVTRNGGTAETTTFTYDEYNKLTTVQHPGGITETLTYNANGQLTQSTKTGGGGGATETTRYYWNDQGFLTKVLLPSGEPVEYKYDGVGRLTGRKDADGEQVFVQAGWSIMTEQDTEGRRTYYTGSSAVKDNSSDRTYFHFNHRGDTVLITNQTGTVTNSLHYEAYGKVTDKTGTPIPANSIPTSSPMPPLFVGAYGIRYDQKTELSYMRMRWYDIKKNRFLSQDLLLSINRYSYVHSSPVTFIDILGLVDVSAVLIGENVHIVATPHHNQTPAQAEQELIAAGYSFIKDKDNQYDISKTLKKFWGEKPFKLLKQDIINPSGVFKDNCASTAIPTYPGHEKLKVKYYNDTHGEALKKVVEPGLYTEFGSNSSPLSNLAETLFSAELNLGDLLYLNNSAGQNSDYHWSLPMGLNDQYGNHWVFEMVGYNRPSINPLTANGITKFSDNVEYKPTLKKYYRVNYAILFRRKSCKK